MHYFGTGCSNLLLEAALHMVMIRELLGSINNCVFAALFFLRCRHRLLGLLWSMALIYTTFDSLVTYQYTPRQVRLGSYLLSDQIFPEHRLDFRGYSVHSRGCPCPYRVHRGSFLVTVPMKLPELHQRQHSHIILCVRTVEAASLRSLRFHKDILA